MLEPFLLKLIGGPEFSPIWGIRLSGGVTARVSAYTDDITVCVSSCWDISWVSAEILCYEQMTEDRINKSKSTRLRPRAWKERALLGMFE